MDVRKTENGSLQISADAVAKIAQLATLEVDGVAGVATGGAQSVRGVLSKTNLQKPVTVELQDGVAMLRVNILAVYGCKVMQVCEHVQENVKHTVQNMTGITVSRVDVIVAGLAERAGAKS